MACYTQGRYHINRVRPIEELLGARSYQLCEPYTLGLLTGLMLMEDAVVGIELFKGVPLLPAYP